MSLHPALPFRSTADGTARPPRRNQTRSLPALFVVAYADFSFSTVGGTPGSIGDEEWTPTSDWQTHRGPSKYESLPDLQAPHGTTALAGQVLKLNGDPLVHVTLELGNRTVQSDSTGRFLLTDIPSGHQVLVIDGATANSPGKTYGRFEFGDEIKAGLTNKLDFKIWMSLLARHCS